MQPYVNITQMYYVLHIVMHRLTYIMVRVSLAPVAMFVACASYDSILYVDVSNVISSDIVIQYSIWLCTV